MEGWMIGRFIITVSSSSPFLVHGFARESVVSLLFIEIVGACYPLERRSTSVPLAHLLPVEQG